MKSLEKTNQEEFSVAIPASLNEILCRHLLRTDKQEDVAFALYKPSEGKSRFTALIHQIIFPEEGDRIVQGNVKIMPQYFRRACQLAAAEGSGLVLLHSHIGPGWQGMSFDDIKTEHGYSPTTLTLANLPFVGLTLATDRNWSGRIWEYQNGWYERNMATTIRVVGRSLRVSYNDTLRTPPAFKNTFRRTITVWGEQNHKHLARIRVGIVGLGSVGSIVAETLARMGIERIVLMDFDEVQDHNLDRLLGATPLDIGHGKTYVAERQLRKSATAAYFEIRNVPHAITENEGYRNALDCDVLFSCVDRPWPRAVLNHLAYNHLIPVIDGGIKVRLNPVTLQFEGADWQLQTVGPDRACLRCLKAYSPSDVSTEQEGLLDDPSYLAGLPVDHTFKRNENIFPFSANLASLEVMQFVEMVTGIGSTDYYEPQRYSYNQGLIRLMGDKGCEKGCDFMTGIALGDTFYPAPIGFDHSAAAARERQL